MGGRIIVVRWRNKSIIARSSRIVGCAAWCSGIAARSGGVVRCDNIVERHRA